MTAGQTGGYALFDDGRDPTDRVNPFAADPARAGPMVDRLRTRRAAQLGYYANNLYPKEWYAPVLPDP